MTMILFTILETAACLFRVSWSRPVALGGHGMEEQTPVVLRELAPSEQSPVARSRCDLLEQVMLVCAAGQCMEEQSYGCSVVAFCAHEWRWSCCELRLLRSNALVPAGLQMVPSPQWHGPGLQGDVFLY